MHKVKVYKINAVSPLLGSFGISLAETAARLFLPAIFSFPRTHTALCSQLAILLSPV